MKHVSAQSLLTSSMLIMTAGGGFSPLRTVHLGRFSGPVGLHHFLRTGGHGGGSGNVFCREAGCIDFP